MVSEISSYNDGSRGSPGLSARELSLSLKVAMTSPENATLQQIADLREGAASSYRPRACFNLSAGGAIFLECSPQHEYLYDCYSLLGNTGLLKKDLDPWRDREQLLTFLRVGLTAAQDYRSSLFLMTLDHLLEGSVADDVVELIRSSGIFVYGMLHRVPTERSRVDRLRQLSGSLKKTVVLAIEIKKELETKFGLSNVEYLPHHASIGEIPSMPRATTLARLGIPKEKCVVSLIGEVRDGKGLDLILASLHHLNEGVRDKICLLFGGKATPGQIEHIDKTCSNLGIMACVMLQHVDDSRQYAAISDLEYADYVRATDIGLLVYQKGQRLGMSGALPNFVSSSASVIVTADSYAGRLAFSNALGEVLVDETPQELAEVIMRLVDIKARGAVPTANAAYLAEISWANVAHRLSQILKR